MPGGRGTCRPTASNSCTHKSEWQEWSKETRAAVTQTTNYTLRYPRLLRQDVSSYLPHRSGTEDGWGHCDAVHERMRRSDCGTSRQPPYRNAERSPGHMQKIVPSLFLLTQLTALHVRPGFIFGVVSFYLRVNAEVLSGGKGQSQEVVALSCLLSIKLHQLPQLLHNLLRRQKHLLTYFQVIFFHCVLHALSDFTFHFSI